jgi:hypothetical protein
MEYLRIRFSSGDRRRVAVVLSFAMAVAALFSSPAPAAEGSLEQAVKASYLFKFAPFVEWPPSAFSGANSNFQICIAGQNPFGPLMDDVVRGQRISGRAIVVRKLSATPIGQCNILFAGKPAANDADVVSIASGKPILTVTDVDSGVGGTMIAFVMKGGRVRFQINDAIARANGLRISSKLLQLAVAVDRK